MEPIALFISHRTQPGQRDAVQGVWRRHMAPAISANPGHVAYHYCLDPADADVVVALQQYRSAEDAQAFLQTDAYAVYEREVTPLLADAPQVRRLLPVWRKGD